MNKKYFSNQKALNIVSSQNNQWSAISPSSLELSTIPLVSGVAVYPGTISGDASLTTSYPIEDAIAYTVQVPTQSIQSSASDALLINEIPSYSSSNSIGTESTMGENNAPKTGMSTRAKLFFFIVGLIGLGIYLIVNNHNQSKTYNINPNCKENCGSVNFKNSEDNSTNINFSVPK